MATITEPSGRAETRQDADLVEMNWDPITRIVGSLGIYTKIDFANRQVAECHSTSSIFRGYSIFMKGKDPRDAHFITSRICGICGDNHATCATLRAEHGVRRPAARHGRMDHQSRRSRRVHVRPQHLPGQSGRRRFLRADGQGDQSRRAGTRPNAPTCPHADTARLSHDRRHHARAQSVYRRVLSRGAADEPPDARDVLPDGRPARASLDALSRRRRHRADASSSSPTIWSA